MLKIMIKAINGITKDATPNATSYKAFLLNNFLKKAPFFIVLILYTYFYLNKKFKKCHDSERILFIVVF